MAGLTSHTPQPTAITVHGRSRVLEVGFNDGTTFRIPFELMRVYSPSAEVQGHGPGQEVLQTGKREVELTALEPVGNYAVQPRFSDGHDTGIFSWDYLYFLGSQQAELWQKYEERLAEAGVERDDADAEAATLPPSACGHFALERRSMSDTHFGFEQVDETAKAGAVRGVFDSVAPKYDLMNDLMSLGLHRAWKAYTVAVANVRHGRQRARPRRRHRRPGARLRRARRATPAWSCTPTSTRRCCARAATACSTTAWSCRRCSAMPRRCRSPAASFDLVSVAFGLRNMTHKDKALAEMARVLKPGGRLLVLEFSKVAAPLEKAYDWYSFNVLPRIGQLVAGDGASYRYLAESIRVHPDQATLKAMMKTAGFAHVDVHNLAAGVVALHVGIKC